MMIECGGHTLELEPNIYSPGKAFYGICQWSARYYPEIIGTDFETQLAFLVETMPTEFDGFSYCFKKGFSYDEFLAMEDPAEAALAFAKVYERCGSGSYELRQRAAKTAYNYFVLGD
jgi:hypothetical protein